MEVIRLVKIKGFQCWQVKDGDGTVLLQYVWLSRKRKAIWNVPSEQLHEYGGYHEYLEHLDYKVKIR